MTTVTKFTNTAAAGTEVHARAERHMSTKGGTYAEAVRIVLKADPELAEAYAQPAPAEKRSQPAVPVAADDEREIGNGYCGPSGTIWKARFLTRLAR